MRSTNTATLCALLVALHAFPDEGAAQTTPVVPPSTATSPGEFGRVNGVVFDSVAMLPVRGASVSISGTQRTAVSDDRGRYEIDSVPPGRRIVTYSAPAFDSLGLGSLGVAVTVSAGVATRALLATPSVATLWRALCGSRPRLGPENGIVWGTVLDVSTGRLLEDAATRFSWYELKSVNKKVDIAELKTEVRSDSTGTYYACGLPTDVAITSQAFGTATASGEVTYAIGERSLQRLDLAVSGDMVTTASAGDSASAQARSAFSPVLRGRGSSVLRGTVRDDRGRAVADALLSVTSADTAVRTARDGSYVLQGMPGGTQSVQVRSLGFAMTTKLVDLRPNEATEANFSLPIATTLATFNVRSERAIRPDHQEFLERRKLGMGYAREFNGDDFQNASTPLLTIPRLAVTYSRGFATVSMTDGAGSCTPNVFLDGLRTDMEAMSLYPVESLRAVEVYSKYLVPLRFMSSAVDSCGAILYWTRYRW